MADNKDKKVLNVPALRFPEFSGEWKREILNDVCAFHNGRAYKQNELLSDGKYRVLRVGNFFTNDSWYYSDLELDDEKVAVNGDLLYAWSASFGPRFWTGEKVIYHYHIWKIDSFQQVSKEFLFYFLERDTEKIKNEVQGGTMVHITKGDMEKREILYPSILEQSKIARLLSLLDERIATQNRIIEKLETLIKGIIETVISSQKTNAVIKNCLECNSSTLQESQVAENGTFPVYGATDISGYAEAPDVNGESILIIKDGSGVGTVKFVTGEYSFIGTLNRLTAKDGYCLKYIYFALQRFSFEPYKTGMAIPHIYFKDYGKAKIYCPSLSLQTLIAQKLSLIENKMDVEKRIILCYQLQKSYLLSRMFI